MLCYLIPLSRSTEYFVKWNGDNRTICHSMWPCSWDVAVSHFKKDDIIQITDKELNTTEKLEKFRNMTTYVLNTGGGIAGCGTIIDGSNYIPTIRDFFIEISPFNESLLYGFKFVNFNHPIMSVQGMEMFFIVDCFFTDNQVHFDFPMLIFNNVTAIMANGTISRNIVEATSLIGLSTAILGLNNMTVEENTQISRGPIPLIEFTNAASEITNSTIKNNISPNSPLFGSWFFIIVYIIQSTISNNYCGSSALIVGDSLANITIDNSSIMHNIGALVHSMTMSSINISYSRVSENYASGMSLIFAPRSVIQFLSETIVENNIVDSIISSQLTNETSLILNSTIFNNNSCVDTAFALYNSESQIINSSVSSNTVIGHPFISIQASNFTIDNSQFNSNWATEEGSVFKIIDSSLNANSSSFKENIGISSGAFDISIETNETMSYIFKNLSFYENEGFVVGSVLFSNKIPASRFESCKFSKDRFSEVNGHLNMPQTFHRCRFNMNEENDVEFSFKIETVINPDRIVYIMSIIMYILSSIVIISLYFIHHDETI